MTLDPKPCPWCGQSPVIGSNDADLLLTHEPTNQSAIKSGVAVDYGFRVECPCGACGPRMKFRTEAIFAWNKATVKP